MKGSVEIDGGGTSLGEEGCWRMNHCLVAGESGQVCCPARGWIGERLE